MNFSAIFIKRPVMATLLMAAFLIAGLFGYSSLPVSELPNVDLPTITVNATLVGSDAQTMALKQLMQIVRQQGIVMGFADVFLMLAVLFVAFGALAIIMRRPSPQPAPAGH